MARRAALMYGEIEQKISPKKSAKILAHPLAYAKPAPSPALFQPTLLDTENLWNLRADIVATINIWGGILSAETKMGLHEEILGRRSKTASAENEIEGYQRTLRALYRQVLYPSEIAALQTSTNKKLSKEEKEKAAEQEQTLSGIFLNPNAPFVHILSGKIPADNKAPSSAETTLPFYIELSHNRPVKDIFSDIKRELGHRLIASNDYGLPKDFINDMRAQGLVDTSLMLQIEKVRKNAPRL